jgi:hypothetical protein
MAAKAEGISACKFPIFFYTVTNEFLWECYLMRFPILPTGETSAVNYEFKSVKTAAVCYSFH